MSSREFFPDSPYVAGSLLLVTTSDEQELLSGDLWGLLASVESSARVVVVLRDVNDDLALAVERQPQVLGVVRTPPVGISEARNAALDWIQAEGVAATDAIVAFPDDDCRYPGGMTTCVRDAFEAHGCDVLLGSYGPSEESIDRHRFPVAPKDVARWQDLHLVASAGVFIPWRTLGTLRFNPYLGVGAPLPAAEEVDLILRLLSQGRKVTYDPRVNVIHPYRTHIDRLARWEAWIALCTGHALASPRHLTQGVRAWIGWASRVVRRQVTVRSALLTARKALNPRALKSIRASAREAAARG